uniref:Secreted protein n=1 Tax=Heterorhabditis bacteriophora TaxID=37862 RepID=A0A1I7WLW2_HETBA
MLRLFLLSILGVVVHAVFECSNQETTAFVRIARARLDGTPVVVSTAGMAPANRLLILRQTTSTMRRRVCPGYPLMKPAPTARSRLRECNALTQLCSKHSVIPQMAQIPGIVKAIVCSITYPFFFVLLNATMKNTRTCQVGATRHFYYEKFSIALYHRSVEFNPIEKNCIVSDEDTFSRSDQQGQVVGKDYYEPICVAAANVSIKCTSSADLSSSTCRQQAAFERFIGSAIEGERHTCSLRDSEHRQSASSILLVELMPMYKQNPLWTTMSSTVVSASNNSQFQVIFIRCVRFRVPIWGNGAMHQRGNPLHRQHQGTLYRSNLRCGKVLYMLSGSRCCFSRRSVRQHRLLYRYIILSRFILHTELHRSDSVSHSSLSSPPFNCFQLWFSQQMLRLLISHLWF